MILSVSSCWFNLTYTRFIILTNLGDYNNLTNWLAKFLDYEFYLDTLFTAPKMIFNGVQKHNDRRNRKTSNV